MQTMSHMSPVQCQKFDDLIRIHYADEDGLTWLHYVAAKVVAE